MVFSSVSFLFLFLPVTLAIFFFLPKKLKFLFLSLSSLLFYFWGENYLVWILITSTTIDYFCGILIDYFKRRSDKNKRVGEKIVLGVSILSNLSFLAYFKYFNFFIDSYNSLIESLGLSGQLSLQIAKIALPLGISFYTFQSMSYTIDVYRGKVKATKNFLKFAAFVTMFPQLVAGPIVLYKNIENDLNNHVLSIDKFVKGIKRFSYGLGKKVLIANVVAQSVDNIYALPQEHLFFSLAWLANICYAIQIYFDFSGYSDMAIGLGHIMGFDFPENFNYPYIASSTRDIWRRWHMTLTGWLQSYVYIPLGGSRCSATRCDINIFIVFALCGLWHGADWTFILWGVGNGLIIIVERRFLSSFLEKMPLVLRRFYAVGVFLIGLVLVRSDSVPDAFYIIKTLFGFGNLKGNYCLTEFLQGGVWASLLLGIILSYPVFPKMKVGLKSRFESKKNVFSLLNLSEMILIVIILILSASRIASGTYNPFIYFRF